MGFNIKELFVILIIVLLVFGTTKLKTLGNDMAKILKDFKNSFNEEKKKNIIKNNFKKQEINKIYLKKKIKQKTNKTNK